MSGKQHPVASFASACIATAVLAAVALPAAAQSVIEPEAKQILKRSMDYLGGLQRVRLITDNSTEVVLEDGQKLQFDSSTAASIQRPNRFHAVRFGELADQEFFYDGKTLTLHQVDAGFYATVAAPPTLDGMLDFARDSLDIVAPAGDFLYSDAYELLMDGVDSGFVVGETVVGGQLCDHLAFSKPGTDFQVWVARGEQPLPIKLVITSRDVLNAPQFTVVIREWDIAPDLPSETFTFVQPEDAAAIEFIVLEPGSD